MAYKKRNSGRSDTSGFVMLYHWEMDCPAYQSLSLCARALYTEFKRRFKGNNNGEIHFSVREMQEALGVGSQMTAVKAQHELQRKGFIKVARLATFDTRKQRTATYFILTCEPLHNVNATKEFMRWSPESNEFKVISGKRAHQKKNSTKN